ncbi:hypothetical protein FRB99_004187, partial [Tulasnella sp. 403]
GASSGFTLRALVEVWFPWIARVFPDDRCRTIKKSQETINRVGSQIVQRKKEEVTQEKLGGNYVKSKDMLSLLIQANMLENSANRLSDEDLLTQISTLLFAGSDTTSMGLCWALYFLSLNQDIQQKLREALAPYTHESPSPADQTALLSLPYLDHVIKEALRLVPPVHSTLRVASEDHRIPTSDGTEVFIREGQFVHVAIEAFNIRKDVWGEDSFEFKPERWASLPPAAKASPGLVMGLMSFILGPHSCPGYQFAMLEMKAILAALIPAFVFEPAPDKNIRMGNLLVTRPFVKENGEWSSRLPLLVRPYST